MALSLDLWIAAIDFGVIVALVGTSMVIWRQVRVLGKAVAMMRLFLVRKGTERVTVLLFAALSGLIASNAFQLATLGIDVYVEIASLGIVLLALLQVARIFHQMVAAKPLALVPA